ncbi:MAG: magnesium transporter [Gemmataceae bacterium]|nr:magnesium transporter [Gemmataceae bacterium]
MAIELPKHLLQDPITRHMRTDYPRLRPEMTVNEALCRLRQEGVGEKIVYFYVLDGEQRLVGVLPTRRLLTADLDKRLDELMIGKVIAVPDSATVSDACEFFVLHKLLAFPVVDTVGRMIGLVDVNFFTEEMFDMAEREQADSLFEALGFHLAQVRDASPIRAFRYRFPWLLATIASGTLCALLASAFEMTLAQSLVLAFFLTLVLGLGESVSMQSMTVTIQSLRNIRPTLTWYLRALWREAGTAFLLGAGCGLTVALIVWVWRGEPLAALVIGLGILGSLVSACVIGLSIPALLHALRLDPKIAAGPISLALADICTLLFYFSLAAMLL